MDQPDTLSPPGAAAGARPASPPRSAPSRWTSAALHRRATTPPERWPADLLMRFSLRMARHGMSISRLQMCSDSGYASAQFAHARSLADPELHQLVACLCTPAPQAH